MNTQELTTNHTDHTDHHGHRPTRRTRKMKGLHALVATGALTLLSATAVATNATPAAAAAQVQVTYCWTYGSFQPVPAGMYTYAQYYDGSRNNWATPPQNYTFTNNRGCIFINVTPGYAWRFQIYAYGRWQSDSGSHVSSGGYLGMTRVS